LQLDAFVFKLLVLSIPGFISYTIYKKIAIYRREIKSRFGFPEVFLIIINSLICCIVYDVIISLINNFFQKAYIPTLSKLLSLEMYNAKELLFLSIIAIFIGFLFSLIETHKIINELAIKLKITQHYGDNDVWTSFCANKDTNWIYIRDHKMHLVYFGLLMHYSDPGEVREMLISDVSVYSEDGKFCYEIPKMYICRQADEITLEVPQEGEGSEDEKINDKDG
jgi:hypothetical protein